MKRLITPVLLIASFTLFVAGTSAKQRAGAIMADEAPPEPPDPKKKKAGDQCTSSDECQKHHTCVKNGDKGICTAPPRPKLPPGVVT